MLFNYCFFLFYHKIKVFIVLVINLITLVSFYTITDKSPIIYWTSLVFTETWDRPARPWNAARKIHICHCNFFCLAPTEEWHFVSWEGNKRINVVCPYVLHKNLHQSSLKPPIGLTDEQAQKPSSCYKWIGKKLSLKIEVMVLS